MERFTNELELIGDTKKLKAIRTGKVIERLIVSRKTKNVYLFELNCGESKITLIPDVKLKDDLSFGSNGNPEENFACIDIVEGVWTIIYFVIKEYTEIYDCILKVDEIEYSQLSSQKEAV